MSIAFPAIDPVAFTVASKPIYWYGIVYAVSILVGFWFIQYLDNKQESLFSKNFLDDLFFWVVIGIVVGGRLGYALFYMPRSQFGFLEILKIWQGGMSFHGGVIGVIIALYFLCRKYMISFFKVSDILVCAVPIGLAAGRIGNFINGELYGRVTSVSWAIKFPMGGYLPRHPSQIYESIMEGILLWIILFVATRFFKLYKHEGILSGIFLLGYSIARFSMEFFREPDAHIGFLGMGMTLGQWLTLPMLLYGTYLLRKKAEVHV